MAGMTTNDALLFHEKCGTLIKLSNNNKTAERRRPLDEFNNGVVMTNRPLRHNEMFEVITNTSQEGCSHNLDGLEKNNIDNNDNKMSVSVFREFKLFAVLLDPY